jgi:hypothetical protein
MSIIQNDTLPGSPQSQGFKTKYEIKNMTNSGVMLNVWFEKDDPSSNFFNLSVTWVVILINPSLYMKTAQFSTLNHNVQQDITTSNIPIVIQNYNQTYEKNLLIGSGGFMKITPYSSSIDFTLSTSSITFITNSLTSQHFYLLMQLTDKACPSANPYKYKNDLLCYPCTIGT